MKSWGRLIAGLTLFIGALGVFMITENVHADDNSGGSFSIYATRADCSYYDNNLIQDPCPSSTSKTAEVRLGDNGEYSIGDYNGTTKDRIGIRIDGKQLILEPNCNWFSNCSEWSISLGDNINDAYNNVNAALNGKTWVQINNSVGSSYYTDTQYLFSAEDVTDPTKVPAPPGSTDDPQSVEATCMNSGDMNTLGWILCPAMTLMGDAAEGLYNDAVKPALQVEPKLFTDGNGGAEQAWGVFRNLANVILIIFLLFIIFSQITGVGIDNYGIKKALPKVIVAAILMNLSFFLCEVMIDLSNILGNSLQALFNGLPVGTPPTTLSGVDISEVATGFGTTALTGAVLAAVLVGGIWAAGGGVAVAVGLLVAVIGVVVSIFFLFIILSVRQAAIIVLAVISPIAIICYMLPNTKNWFDKWWKFFGSLLLVYPIAGMLVGGGNFVSKLMLVIGGSDGGFFWAFTAMLASIVPIFFIPTVLRNSLNAAGQLGAKISGIGQRVGSRLSGAADRGIRGSERFKNYQNEVGRRRQENTAQRNINRLNRRAKRMGGTDNLSTRDQRMLARSSEILDRLKREDQAASTILAGSEFAEQTDSELEAAWNDAFDSGSGDRLNALTNVILQRQGSAGANFIGKSLADKKLVDNGVVNQNAVASMKALQDNLRNNSTFSQAMISKASDAFQMISSGGVTGVTTTNGERQVQYGDLSDFSKNNQISTSAGDWATQSGATLGRAITNGALTDEMAHEILDSNDPAIQSGLQTDVGKRDVLQAGLYDRNVDFNDENAVKNAAQQYRAQQQAAAQSVQQAQQSQQDQIAQNLQNINDILSQHGKGGGIS